MELLVLISLSVPFLIGSAATNQNQCGCIDQSWCNKEDPQKRLDCPLSHSLCSNVPLTDDVPGRLDTAVQSVSTECREGWSVASLKDAVYGFPNQLFAIIQNNLTNGNEHTMYIDGYGGKYPARFVFKSNDKTGNVPLFMTMFLWKEYIIMNEKKDGHWCQNDIRVNNRVNSGEWHMQFKVRMWEGKQQFDIQFLYWKYDTIYRFYPQTHIKRGDWFIFYEDYYYILGISWSRIRHVQFKTSPIPGSRIVIHGKFAEQELFNIFLKNEAGVTKMQIAGELGYPSGWGFYPGQNSISGYGHKVECKTVPFSAHKTAVIVIEVTQTGIKYYGDGWLLCAFESGEFKRNDISQIDVNGALQLLAYGTNTCDYYRY